MRSLVLVALLASLGCAPMMDRVPAHQRQEFDHAFRHCTVLAWRRCAGMVTCESDSRRGCLRAHGWVRTEEGWRRRVTDADLGREIERALRGD